MSFAEKTKSARDSLQLIKDICGSGGSISLFNDIIATFSRGDQ